MPQKMLVTGAASMVARGFIKEARKVFELVLFDEWFPKEADLPHYMRNLPRFQGRISQAGALGEAMQGCSLVFHAQIARQVPETPDSERIRINIEGTRQVVEEAKRQGVRKFVYASSLSGFDLYNRLPDIEKRLLKLNEDLPPHPETVYGKTKVEAEKLIGDAAKAGFFRAVILRLASVVPETGDLGSETNLREYVKERISEQWHVSATGIRDVVQAILLAFEKDLPFPCRIYQITGLDSDWRPRRAELELGFQATTGYRELIARLIPREMQIPGLNSRGRANHFLAELGAAGLITRERMGRLSIKKK
jgi:nucleoside-diphosphate-sugar epimerase